MQIIGLTPSAVEKNVSNAAHTPGEAHAQFSQFLKDSINEVNKSQAESDRLTEKLALGQDVDLHTVMIAAQKSSVALQATMEVRNKAVEAYQEIMRMQI